MHVASPEDIMSGYGKQIILTVSIAVVIAVGLGLGVYYTLPQLGRTNSSTTSSTTGSGSTSNTTSVTTPNLGPCSTSYQGGGSFYVNESSNLDLCVEFYYYNSGSPINVIPTDQLTIQAYNSSLDARNAISNFTVTASPSNFQIGGSSNENEGIAVEYQIHANAISNGTYVLNLGWLLPQQQECTFEFSLVVGNGIPNYTANLIGHCVTASGSSNFPYPPNILFAEVVSYQG
jgi:hypothetical protein